LDSPEFIVLLFKNGTLFVIALPYDPAVNWLLHLLLHSLGLFFSVSMLVLAVTSLFLISL
jgi:hypothetical protein